MKRIIFLTIIVLFLNTLATAQDEMGFDSKFALGLGFTPGWIKADVNAINDKMPGIGIDKLPAGFFATGGSGFISIPFIRNLRIGGMGFGGSTSNSSVANGLNKEVMYSVSMGGFTAEYTFPFIPNVAVSIGAILGRGSNTIEIYQHRTELNWDGIWQEVSNPAVETQNIHRKLTNKHFMVTPTLNIDIPFYRFFAFRIGAGYKIAFSETWEYDNNQPLNNIPSKLNSNLLFLQAGIYIGFFNY